MKKETGLPEIEPCEEGCLATLTALVALPVVGWWLGVTLPAYLIESGTEHREGLEKRMAEGAVGNVELHWGLTFDSMTFMVEKRVTSVRKCPGTPSGEEFEEMVSMLGGYSAEVRLYTLFGIPYGTAEIHCYREPSLKEGSLFSLLR